ncbi:hypothetical protein PVK06_048180 [Gossypium arboreum]|uniref:RNase H type-1 domain-containing protein n=1 Tax=Gossypium arboreum TaxID=29729 RepID=A0ABR0MFC4_GOSAR|nr:hypothetical protein PVK06_048180 [Gossypium arboreum]
MAWTTNMQPNFWEWLTMVFEQGTDEQCRYFFYAFWLLWYARNQVVHERVYSTGVDLTQKVQNLVAEYEGVRAKKSLLNMVCNQRTKKTLPIINIQFDVAFDSRNYRSKTGLVVWGNTNEYLASKSFIHYDVVSPFATEAYAGLEAVELGIEMGFQEIQIQGDSLTVVKKYQSTTIDYSVIEAIIRDIQAKKLGF